MTTEFILPDIGEGIVECELLEWLVAEGDTIEEDQPVAELYFGDRFFYYRRSQNEENLS